MYNIIWYNGDNFSTKLSTDMLITKGKKRITNRSNPFVKVGAGFDCETSTFDHAEKYATYENGEKKIFDKEKYDNSLKSFVYVWQFSVGTDVYLCNDVLLFDSFLCDLDNAVDELHPRAQLIIWDCNITFEFSFFMPVIKNGIKKIFARSKSNILSFDYGRHLQFRECLGVFGKSLKDIAKNYTTTQKLVGDLDYSKIRIPFITPFETHELNYCVNDVAILSELTEKAFEMYIERGKKIPLTQTGIVRDEIIDNYAPNPYVKEMIYNENAPLIGTQEQYYTWRKYVYSGGLTHSNFYYVGDAVHDVTCYDLTSAYPWALNTKYYPSGEIIEVDIHNKHDVVNAFKHKHYFCKVTLKKLESKSTHSTLSMHKVTNMTNPVIDNGRIYSADSVTLYLTEVDLKNMKAIYKYDDYVIHELYYFTKSVRIPRKILNVMNTWYKKKTLLKPLTSHEHEHDKNYAENCKEYKRLKALINSVYGMTVTALYDTETIWNTEQKEVTDNARPWDKASKTLFNPWHGYYCTAYVRERLIECISKFPDSIIQYDTDSIYCLPNGDLKKYVDLVNDRVMTENKSRISEIECLDLGLWDNDGFYKDFICLGSKRYVGRYESGDLKITFAGASEFDIKSECTRLNMDIFDYIKKFSITENMSTKKGAYHFSGTYSAMVTDYLGNTALCTTYGGATIKTVDFKANLSHAFKHLKTIYLNERTK